VATGWKTRRFRIRHLLSLLLPVAAGGGEGALPLGSRLTAQAPPTAQGQAKQDCNTDFAVVDLGGDFVNSSFGVPPIIPMPTFPNPSMAAALFCHPTENVALKAGVWDGEPQIGNWGFSGTGVTFTIGEFKAKYDLRADKGLPGDFHAGA
jgi:hypothetical protein